MIGTSVRLLFAISVVSFCTVLWLALATARRIRRDQEARRTVRARKKPVDPPTAMEFFEAGDFRTPRVLRLNQQISQHDARRPREAIVPPGTEQESRRRPVDPPSELRTTSPSVAVSHLNAPDQALAGPGIASEAVIIDSKLQFVAFPRPRQSENEWPVVASRNTPRDLSGERKSPQSVRSGRFRRVDLSHYNEGLGDLTDPYTHAERTS